MQTISPLQIAFATNSTSASFTQWTVTNTEPVGVRMGEDAAAAGIFNIPSSGNLVPDKLRISFFGAGSDNDTFSARIIGWERRGSNPVTTEWNPIILATFACTLSSMVRANVATDKIVDTITETSMIAPEPRYNDLDATPAVVYGGTCIIASPANNFEAFAIVPIYGVEKIQFDFDMTGATSGNCWFRFLNDN